MGMGLSICKSIIEDHGGRLWASPDMKNGSVFNISLPINEVARQAGRPSILTRQRGVQSESAGSVTPQSH